MSLKEPMEEPFHYEYDKTTRKLERRPGLMDGDTQETLPGVPKNTVNSPDHYTWHPTGIECADVSEHFDKNLGSALEYIWRAGRKINAIEDLQKAIWFINREIERLKKYGGE